MKTIQVLSKEHGHPVSPELFGIFFEDINFGCDGGLNANMVKNYSFDGVFLNAEGMCAESDPLRYWILDGGSLASGSENFHSCIVEGFYHFFKFASWATVRCIT